ncbi:NAD-P-binding protein [Mycena alexandri]|uniref:NAD-P-binding protein n=1 Tax=Mycena alexandri TaxID=1745969 RepID=A0AAD6T2P3_9AGAR|nr:NAD-P-binding protein [Mycena alexandri]
MSLPTFSFYTTAEEVADTFAEKIRGKNVLVTGTSLNGIGFETARVIAKYANLVIITGYNTERLALSEDAIRRSVPSVNIRSLILDLSSLASVRKAAVEVNTYLDVLHVLIHNAAGTIGPFTLSVDGLEYQMATSHFGPFLFTKLLAPKIIAAVADDYIPRVVFLSSVGHSFFSAGVNFRTLGHPDPMSYEAMDAYGQAKAVSVLDAIELSKRSEGRINAYSVHPGAIFTSIMQKGEAVAGLQKMGVLDAHGLPSNAVYTCKTLGQGASTIMAAAFDPRLNETPGAYLANCVAANELVAPLCAVPANAKRLWDLTEEVIGEAFTF